MFAYIRKATSRGSCNDEIDAWNFVFVPLYYCSIEADAGEVEDLAADRLDRNRFGDNLFTLPSFFVYRAIVKVLCIAVSDEEFSRHTLSAISPQNMIPTCSFALNGTRNADFSSRYVLSPSYKYF